MKHLISFVCGTIFGVGLLISGMTDPQKVIGFLDLFGEWDPSLALVMVGAIATFGVLRLLFQRDAPILTSHFHLPSFHLVDRPLIGGSILFGIGWGVSGFCPGPAVVSAFSASGPAALFSLGMLGGMALFEVLRRTYGLLSPSPRPSHTASRPSR